MPVILNPFTGQLELVPTSSGGGGTFTFNNGLSLTGTQVDVAPGDTSLTVSPGSIIVRLAPLGALATGGSGIDIKVASITDSYISATAGIQLSKLAALTANRVPVTNGSGFLADNTSNDVILVANSFSRGLSGSAIIQEQYLDTITLTDNTTATIASLSFAQATYSGIEVNYIIKTGAGTPDIRIGILKIISNGVTTSISDIFNETADAGVAFSVSISGSNTNVSYTTTNQGSNRTLRADVKRFRA